MPQEKAYSSLNISGEGSTLLMSTLKEYADSATKPLFQFLLLFKKNIYFYYWVVKTARLQRQKLQ